MTPGDEGGGRGDHRQVRPVAAAEEGAGAVGLRADDQRVEHHDVGHREEGREPTADLAADGGAALGDAEVALDRVAAGRGRALGRSWWRCVVRALPDAAERLRFFADMKDPSRSCTGGRPGDGDRTAHMLPESGADVGPGLAAAGLGWRREHATDAGRRTRPSAGATPGAAAADPGRLRAHRARRAGGVGGRAGGAARRPGAAHRRPLVVAVGVRQRAACWDWSGWPTCCAGAATPPARAPARTHRAYGSKTDAVEVDVRTRARRHRAHA